MKPYWECHVTVCARAPSIFGNRKVIEGEGWTFSDITDDPILGPGSKHYATKHFNKKVPIERVYAMVAKLARKLHQKGCIVKRVKIEAVMYDAIRGRDFSW